MRFLVLLVAFFLSAPLRADELPKVNADEIREALADRLKDPYSAQFRKMRFFDGMGDVWKFCGEVNAKNSYGGYTGYTKFSGMAIKDGDKVEYTVTALGEFAC